MKPQTPVSAKRISMQLKYDLIGKDSYRGVTLSYAYLANQTGHFALAFGPASGIYLILRHCFQHLLFPGLWAGKFDVQCFLYEAHRLQLIDLFFLELQ